MKGDQSLILAFDASCGTCRQLAQTVSSECRTELDVRPLDDEDVRGWRRQALGDDPPRVPTLMKLSGAEVRAWTGTRMAVRLVRHLGPRATVRLLRAFGELKRLCGSQPTPSNGIGRKDFLRVAAGTGMAAAFVLFGKAPVFASPAQRSEQARAWVKANPDAIPRDYGGFSAFDLTYRQAIHEALPPRDRARLWTEHLARHPVASTAMSAEQARVLDQATALAADEATFTLGYETKHETLEKLRLDSIAAFGLDTARSLLAILGPAQLAACCRCQCATNSDYCSVRCIYDDQRNRCDNSQEGCGTFWGYGCNGCCSYCGSRGCC
ncbi:bacteriocin fulvocin C-related protein [Asanoa siamensis]|uniref:Secreted protein n=1 Tax=Asanoa siamensis TaxID=926357 RepID=A0ABQ4D4P4_9ACTN|nr:bacteriocin fulvocin C-related protein [Asanoa siamensis]GIF78511.1 hypothetical protein Asi02nite_80290 [Asanoa siamensis]